MPANRQFVPDDLMMEAGRWLLCEHLQQFSEPITTVQLQRLVADKNQLAAITRRAYTPVDPTAIFSELPSSTMARSRTRECINIIDEQVRRSALEGVLVDDALSALAAQLDHHITVDALRNMLRRNYTLHQLRMIGGRITLRTDIIVHELAKRHRQRSRHHVVKLRIDPARRRVR